MGQTLTGSDGTISNGTVSARAWLRGVSAISGATGSTYLLDVLDEGQNISFRVTANGAGGSAQATSTAVGPIAAAPGLTAPDITVTSAVGDPPEVTIGLKADHHPGYFLRIQRNADGAVDVNGDYTSQTLEAANNGVLYFIGADDFADGITNAELEAVGYVDPTGTYFQQYRIENEIDQVSPWVGITGTIVVSVAVLFGTNGTNKSQYIAVSGTPVLTATGSSNTGAANSVRTVTTASGKRHFEVTINAFNATGSIIAGLCDSATALGSAVYPVPGSSSGSVPGCCIILNTTNSTVNRNGGSQSGGVGAWAVGDIAIFEFDTALNTVSIWRQRSGSDTLVASLTLTSLIPTNWTAFVGGYRTGDGSTVNFGATAFAKTPTSGYQIYG